MGPWPRACIRVLVSRDLPPFFFPAGGEMGWAETLLTLTPQALPADTHTHTLLRTPVAPVPGFPSASGPRTPAAYNSPVADLILLHSFSLQPSDPGSSEAW